MSKIYDYIIIGGGISGLHFAYKLNEKTDNYLVLEQKNKLGGRIKTIKVDNKIYEAGANRISENHTEILSLIKELGLSKYLEDETYTYNYYIDGKMRSNSKNLVDKIIKLSKQKMSKKIRMGNTFEGIGEYLNKDYKKAIMESGYDSQLTFSNYDQYTKNYKNYTGKYFKLKNGFIQIIKRLSCLIGKEKIKLEEKVKAVKYTRNVFNIETLKREYKCKNLIFAIPKTNLLDLDILKKYSNLLNCVRKSQSIRVVARYPKKNGKYWFSDINKIVTDKIVRKIVPIDKENGFIEIAYCDYTNADILNYANMNGYLYKFIEKSLKEIFPNKVIPKPNYLRAHYWNAATHWWLPNTDVDKLNEEIMHIDKKIPMFIIGESYSKLQGWMEGALRFSNNLYKYLKKEKNIVKIYRKKEVSKKKGWVIYKNGVYDISSWIKFHPGGNVILEGLGKDITQLFHTVGHSNSAEIKLLKYKIGRLV